MKKHKLLSCSTLMEKKGKIYSFLNMASAVFMILALLWLTVSAPYVYESQQQAIKYGKITNADKPLSENEEESASPFGNNTEEKAPSSISSFSEEFLHDHHKSDYFSSIASQYHKCDDAGTYIAFHGELLVPPPNAA